MFLEITPTLQTACYPKNDPILSQICSPDVSCVDEVCSHGSGVGLCHDGIDFSCSEESVCLTWEANTTETANCDIETLKNGSAQPGKTCQIDSDILQTYIKDCQMNDTLCGTPLLCGDQNLTVCNSTGCIFKCVTLPLEMRPCPVTDFNVIIDCAEGASRDDPYIGLVHFKEGTDFHHLNWRHADRLVHTKY